MLLEVMEFDMMKQEFFDLWGEDMMQSQKGRCLICIESKIKNVVTCKNWARTGKISEEAEDG